MDNITFDSLGLSDKMLTAIKQKGFESPSPVQALTIPALMERTNDLIAQAQTGTGKTAAFAIPLIEKIEKGGTGVKALVLVPTRELAIQVTEESASFNSFKKLSIAPIYGGAAMSEQLRRLKKGIDIVVGTPGRTLDHIKRGTLNLSEVSYLVLDEADEMLNMGFIEDIEEIMSHMSPDKRVLLFSATMPSRIMQLSKKYMKDAEIIRVESKQLTADLTNQVYFEVREGDKFDALTRIIDVEPEFYGIVFSRTKIGVDELVNRLTERGYSAEGLHGDISQAQREKVLKRFRNRLTNVLVATDVAARGIDINDLTHVINFSLPQDSESYVHRIGRTGRAGKQGTDITFISNHEYRQFAQMKKAINLDITKKELPTVNDIVESKRSRIIEELKEIVESGNYTDCMEMATGILNEYDPETALSALIRLAYKNELSESNYPEIRGFTVDRKGKARIFIAIGRKDGYDPRKIVSLIKRECSLSDNLIDDVRIMDDYTFVTVPFSDSEKVVRRLNSIRKGERPIAEIAKESSGKKGGGGSSHSGKPEKRSFKKDTKPGKKEKMSGGGMDWFPELDKKYGKKTEGKKNGRKEAGKKKKEEKRSSSRRQLKEMRGRS